MTRLLLLTPDFPPATGGIQLLLSRLVEHLAGDFDITVATRGVPSRDGGSAVHAEVRVRRTGLTGQPGVIAGNLLGIAIAARSRFDVVLCGHITAAPAGACLQRVRGIPFVQYVHADEVRHRPRLARFALRNAASTIVVSAHTRDIALRSGCPAGRVHIVTPGVDIPASPPPRVVGTAAPTIITVARLEDRYKGHDVMLRALPLVRASVPGVRWVVVGEGSLRIELEAEARRLGIADQIEFTGQISDDERDRRLACADVFAMPSRLPPSEIGGGEGFGIVYLEAGIHGLPVVAGAVGGALDAVLDGETGLLVDPTSCEELAAALSLLLLDTDRARRLGEAGARRARSLTWERMSRGVHAVLTDAIERTN